MPKAYSYIRMSTPQQAKGDSLRRQIALTREWAAKHDLELDETSFPPDIGLSGYDASNIRVGSLGRFLKAVETGEVPRGSYLLVESLDRLSRQDLERSMSLFLLIMNSGITLATISDNQVYRAGENDLGRFVLSLAIMSRSHNESVEKANRQRANWGGKRGKLGKEKMTAMCPAWLRLHKDRTHFEIVGNRGAVIRRIFEQAAGGIGLPTITHRLNDEKQPTFRTSPPFRRAPKGWHQSYVARILKNRAVLGEFQPHKLEGDEIVPAGDVQADYYPKIIDEDLFLRAQQGIAQRKKNGAGRKGRHMTNLFGGLLVCDHCDSRMVFENKGLKPKGFNYIVCEAGRRGYQCRPVRWRYDEFEATFLTIVEEIDLGSIFSTKANDANRKKIQHQLEAHQGKLVELDREFENAYELIKLLGFSSSRVVEKIEKCERETAAVKTEIERLSTELENQRALSASFYDGKNELKVLIAKIKESPDVEAYNLRAQISARLKSIVSSIRVAPMGNVVLKERQAEFASQVRKDTPESGLLAAFTAEPDYEIITERDRLKFFSVIFENGAQRTVYPNASDPTQYEDQYFHNSKTIGWLSDSGRIEHVLVKNLQANSEPNQ